MMREMNGDPWKGSQTRTKPTKRHLFRKRSRKRGESNSEFSIELETFEADDVCTANDETESRYGRESNAPLADDGEQTALREFYIDDSHLITASQFMNSLPKDNILNPALHDVSSQNVTNTQSNINVTEPSYGDVTISTDVDKPINNRSDTSHRDTEIILADDQRSSLKDSDETVVLRDNETLTADADQKCDIKSEFDTAKFPPPPSSFFEQDDCINTWL